MYCLNREGYLIEGCIHGLETLWISNYWFNRILKLFELLDGKYISETIKKEYNNAELNLSKIQVSLGVNNTLQGWANENIFKANPFKKKLPGLENFFMIGQWVKPGGGIPNVFKSGRDFVHIICKKDRKKVNC